MTQKDKKTLAFGAVIVVLVVGYVVGDPWFRDWRSVRTQIRTRRAKIDAVTSKSEAAKKKTDELNRMVPVFEIPALEKKQAVLFRDAFNEQLKKAGLQVKTLQPVGSKSAKRVSGHKLLKYQCRGRCNIDQIFNLMADLNSNPYLAGVEDINLKCDQKDRRQMDFVLTVSTLAR